MIQDDPRKIQIQEAAPELIRALKWIYIMAFDVPEIRARAGLALEFAKVEFERLPCKTA